MTPLPPAVVALLRTWRKQQAIERLAAGSLWENEHDLVFTTPKGTLVDPDNFRHRLAKIAEGAGLGKWTVHELRHSAGTLLFAMGVEVKFITEILGHSSDRVTRDVYIHATDEGKAEALNAMSSAIWGA